VIEVFKTYILQNSGISEEAFADIIPFCTVKKIARKQLLLMEGEVCTFFAFLSKGCLRTFISNNDSSEFIVSFAIENYWVEDRESLYTGRPSRFNIGAIEDSEIVTIDKHDFELIINRLPAFADLINIELRRQFRTSQIRINAAVNYTAEKKYQKFLKNHPEFVLRVPQNMLASYLGITSETLSRVRKRPFK
jgi:CRP-like cAMP-binding protein